MTLHDTLFTSLGTTAFIFGAMALVAAIEALVPLHRRSASNRAHLAPNLALTLATLVTSVALNGALLLALGWAGSRRFGVLNEMPVPRAAEIAIVVLFLDLGFYASHVALHRCAWMWRFHRVHHCDPAVDVTTTIRQHPGEAVIRYAFLAGFGVAIGASPAAFAVYRTWSALHGLLEHANVRVPPRLDTLIAGAIVTPNMHKVHHSRAACETDSNYGNLFSIYDRLLSTFTPTERGIRVHYGLDELADPARQTTTALLALPFQKDPPTASPSASPAF